jgi:hypothetical protein
MLAAAAVERFLAIEELGGRNVPGVLPAAAAFMVAIGVLASLGPARRALRVAPSEALRDGV